MSLRLSDKTALVIDGTSQEGKGIVQAFLREGATVIVPAKSASDLGDLNASLHESYRPRLITFLTDMEDYYTVADITDILQQEFDQIDLAVTVLNTCHQGSLFVETEISEWKTLESSMNAYFIVSRAIFKLLKDPGSMYVTISNAINLEKKANTSICHLESLIHLEMARMFSDEKQHFKTRYHHLFIGNNEQVPVNGLQQKEPFFITPVMIGEHVLRLYQRDVKHPDEIFQCLLDKTFNDQIIRSALNK